MDSDKTVEAFFLPPPPPPFGYTVLGRVVDAHGNGIPDITRPMVTILKWCWWIRSIGPERTYAIARKEGSGLPVLDWEGRTHRFTKKRERS